MDRKKWIKAVAAGSTGLLFSDRGLVFSTQPQAKKEASLSFRILHLTDTHIIPEAVPRFQACIEYIKTNYAIDMVFNSGDSIMAADYNDITRERVVELWNAWDEGIRSFGNIPIHSCLGNHDMWWAAPDKNDEMYGKKYASKRAKMPSVYYHKKFDNWHLITLDGNNEGIRLDEEQFSWLRETLNHIPDHEFVVLMSHYPGLGVGPYFVGGMHSDFEKLKELFYEHKNKVRAFISGHNHLYDYALYIGVHYCCNGAMSGFWWGEGDEKSAGKGYYLETPPGFAIIDLHDDGTVVNSYIPHTF